MRFWLAKNSAVPIQEQIGTQIILGVVSGDLQAGERLPSSSGLARQFRLHPNSVRAGYRSLVERGWLEWRSGSGYYVRGRPNSREEAAIDLDRLIAGFLDVARRQGYSLTEIQTRMPYWFRLQPPDHVLIIEPDEDLRRILVAEVTAHATPQVTSGGLEACRDNTAMKTGILAACLSDHADELGRALPAEVPRLILRTGSIPKKLAGQPRPPGEIPITVASAWPKFLEWTRTILVAVGIDPLSLDLRDARKSGWNRGLTPHSFVIADSLTASRLPAGLKPKVFQIISEESMSELRDEIKSASEPSRIGCAPSRRPKQHTAP